MSELTQCFIAAEPVSINVFNAFMESKKDIEALTVRQIKLEKENRGLKSKVDGLANHMNEITRESTYEDVYDIAATALDELYEGGYKVITSEENAKLKEAGNKMLELLVENAPIEGLWSSDIDDWDMLLGNRG